MMYPKLAQLRDRLLHSHTELYHRLQNTTEAMKLKLKLDPQLLQDRFPNLKLHCKAEMFRLYQYKSKPSRLHLNLPHSQFQQNKD